MNLGTLLKFVDFISTKEKAGLSYTPEMFNLNLPVVIAEIHNKLCENYSKTGIIDDGLIPYKVNMGDTNSPLSVDSDGHASLPDDYCHKTNLSYKYGLKTCPVQVMKEFEFDFKKNSYLTPATSEYPVCTFRSTYIEFLPKDLQFVDFAYIRKPETPVYDYYIDDTLDNIYLTPGTSHLLAAGEEGSAGQITGTTVSSLSVEVTLPEFLHYEIALRLLSKVGINLRDVDIVNYSEVMQKKEAV